MFIIGEFFQAMALLVHGICTILYWLLFARIVISWLRVDPYQGVVQFIFQVTEPILAPFRRLPLQVGMLDLSPLVAFLAIFFVRNVLFRIFMTLAYQFGVS
ncbi:MAG: YggT family protein [Candidatus Omnitrophica bacterium]|nr:YggT family protein [Candidatus Omnitrophota bacterium]